MTTTSTGRLVGPTRPYRVFISYSSSDRIVAKPIAAQLERRGAVVFSDHDRLEYGERFRLRIAAVESSMCSSASSDSLGRGAGAGRPRSL